MLGDASLLECECGGRGSVHWASEGGQVWGSVRLCLGRGLCTGSRLRVCAQGLCTMICFWTVMKRSVHTLSFVRRSVHRQSFVVAV